MDINTVKLCITLAEKHMTSKALAAYKKDLNRAYIQSQIADIEVFMAQKVKPAVEYKIAQHRLPILKQQLSAL